MNVASSVEGALGMQVEVQLGEEERGGVWKERKKERKKGRTATT